MNLSSFYLLLFCVLSLGICEAKIVSIDSITQIAEENLEETVFFFDIDDTLMDSPTMLSSKGWREYVKSLIPHRPDNLYGHISLFVTLHWIVGPVEPTTTEFFNTLQEKGAIVLGLTARKRNSIHRLEVAGLDQITVEKLGTIGIDFSKTNIPDAEKYLTLSSEYYKGIHFVDTSLKGEYLLRLLQNSSKKPKRVVFIDDFFSHVESVDSALESLGIESICYHYKYTDIKGSEFDPLIANIQLHNLYYYDRIITDNEATIIAISNPQLSANDYWELLFQEFVNRLKKESKILS